MQVSDLGTSPTGGAYLVMEYLEGETLAQRLQDADMRLPEEEVIRTGWQIAGTLAAAHAKNIVHRDIKPANIMIVPDPAGPGGERVKVLDFGIAKLASSAVHTKVGQIMGTISHMSPEQIRTAANIDGQSDVYSLGTVLYYLLAGRPPFSGKSDLLVLTMHLSHDPEPINRLVPELSQATTQLIMRMLEKEPAARPKMSEVAEQLLALDPAASSQSLRRSRASSAAIRAISPPSESSRPSRPNTEPLMVSTLAHSAGQSVSPQNMTWRKALPALCALALTLGAVATVAILRNPPDKRDTATAAGRPLKRPPPPPPPAVAPPETDDAEPAVAAAKPARSSKSKAGAADARNSNPAKPRKKNAPPSGKTTPLIR